MKNVLKQALMIAMLSLVAASQAHADAGLEESYGYSSYVWGLPLNDDYVEAYQDAEDNYYSDRNFLEGLGYTTYYLGNDAWHQELGSTGKFRAVVVFYWGYYD